jgi:hypothetical protein
MSGDLTQLDKSMRVNTGQPDPANTRVHVAASNALVKQGSSTATAKQQGGTHLRTGRVAAALCCIPTLKSWF